MIKTRGVITIEEYKQAEAEAKFTIAKTIHCCYCQETVKINPRTNETLLICPQHGTMRLEVENTEYRATSISQPTRGTMSFYLHRLNGRLFDEEATLLAENKGCPFCQWNLQPGITHIGEIRLKNQLLNDPLYCHGCDISFLVIARQGALRFQPKAKHLQNALETKQYQTHLEDDWYQTDNAPDTNTADTVEVSGFPTPTETAISVVENDSETKSSLPAPANQKKNTREQILRVLHRNASPMQRKDIQAQVDGKVSKPLAKLISDGVVVQPKWGWYALRK